MNCCICLALENGLTEREAETARQYRRVFPTRPIVLLAPDSHPMVAKYEELLAPVHVRRLPVVSFTSSLELSRAMLAPEFYDLFDGYDYVLFTSLRTWPLYDALDWWTDRGYDYVAAPWLSLGGAGSTWVRNLDMPRGGCGSASLRRVKAVREFVRCARIGGFDFDKYQIHEDVVLSGGIPARKTVDLPALNLCPRAEQARFAWNRPSASPGDADCDLRTLEDVTRGHLPMLMLDPQGDARKWFCVPDEEPGTIFMFSSAVRAEFDYESLVDSAEPDPAKRLLVFMNKCAAFRENESGWRLVQRQGRILTTHNDTADPPFGPSYFGEIPYFLRNAGFEGRHDSLALRWSSAGTQRVQASATYDGEIPDVRATEVLQSIGPEVGSGAPTCGYQTYRILRDRYPKSRIAMVNFYGNSNGFLVSKRHDVGWEQRRYREDPLVSFLYTEEKKG